MITGIGGRNGPSAWHRPLPRADDWPGADVMRFRLCGITPPSARTSLPSSISTISSCDPTAPAPRITATPAANPHSGLAAPESTGACRGFLPRGLCNACPRSVATSSRPCA